MTDEILLSLPRLFAPVDIRVDLSGLTEGDRAALPHLIAAARIIDRIFLSQRWSGNQELLQLLQTDTSQLGQARLWAFLLNKGPWSDLHANRAFLEGVPERKPLGAAFYPEGLSCEEFELWAGESGQGRDFCSLIRREGNSLVAVPYADAYREELRLCGDALRDAAQLTTDVSLRRFLLARADAFASNDYFESDIAWMDVDAALEVTIGPYETYNDELFGYKAAFEAYITVRDDIESAKLKFFGEHMQELEDNLPVNPQFRNAKAAPMAPVRIVNQVFAAGDGDQGVKAAAFNLPNDERVVAAKGTKQVMLKNVQEAKFRSVLLPVAKAVLAPAAIGLLQFDSFFTHILAHEISHGIGPRQITVDGRATTPRQELKDAFSAIEEAKADILGLFVLQHFHDRGYAVVDEESLYTTYLASSFRTLRFGLSEAHGKGMAIQFNTMMDRGAFVQSNAGWSVDVTKFRGAVRELARELLAIEATGDLTAARTMLDRLGVLRPEVAATLASIGDVPVDIDVQFVTAESLGCSPRG